MEKVTKSFIFVVFVGGMNNSFTNSQTLNTSEIVGGIEFMKRNEYLLSLLGRFW